MMAETIKQAVARARGDVFVLLHENYAEPITPLRLKVSKPEAKRVIDAAPKNAQPRARWEGEDLVLDPNADGWM